MFVVPQTEDWERELFHIPETENWDEEIRQYEAGMFVDNSCLLICFVSQILFIKCFYDVFLSIFRANPDGFSCLARHRVDGRLRLRAYLLDMRRYEMQWTLLR